VAGGWLFSPSGPAIGERFLERHARPPPAFYERIARPPPCGCPTATSASCSGGSARSWNPDSQLKRLARTAAAGARWAVTVVATVTGTDGKSYQMVVLPRRSIPMWAATLDASRCAPAVLELNSFYMAGYNVPTTYAPPIPALSTHFARSTGDAGATLAEILESALVLAGEPVEQSPAVWLFDRRP
jgi:hypothetical protein